MTRRRPALIRRPLRLTVRARMTVLVGLATAAVLLPTTVIGLGRVEAALLDDVFDDAAAYQAEYLGALVDLMGDAGASEAITASGLAQSSSGFLAQAPTEIELDGFSADEVPFMADEARRIHDALVDLDRSGHLDGLLGVTRSDRQSGVPVVMSDGSVAAFSVGGRAGARLIEPDSVDHPVIAVFGLNDLVYRTGGFEPAVLEAQFKRSGLGDQRLGATRIAFASRNLGGTDFVVGADVSNVIRSVDGIRSIMWFVSPLVVSAAALAAWMLTGRALRPVERITEQVRQINTGTLGERVPRPDTGDEIDRLAATMNAMLDRLESSDVRLRQFVSDASHELRTPVAVLRTEAEVALKAPGVGSPVADLAAGVLVETERLQRIVDDLLVLARHDESHSPRSDEEVDLDDVVLAEAVRSRRVPIDVRAVSAARVTAVPDHAARIVAHLLDNAARHARGHVAVGLATRPAVAPASASVSGREAVLSIDDDGPGIAEADRDRIFERFTHLSEARNRDTGGAGLGLAVVKALVTELGGRVTVDDSDLGGARFTVVLPAAP